jgi:hypothetical protein
MLQIDSIMPPTTKKSVQILKKLMFFVTLFECLYTTNIITDLRRDYFQNNKTFFVYNHLLFLLFFYQALTIKILYAIGIFYSDS